MQPAGTAKVMISWDDLRYANAIGDACSLAGAAEELGVDYTTVYRRLGNLEQQLGCRLFERMHAGYTPTYWGEQMLDMARRLDEGPTVKA
jgi:DNA-binding transcriptional LysR family regulator